MSRAETQDILFKDLLWHGNRDKFRGKIPKMNTADRNDAIMESATGRKCICPPPVRKSFALALRLLLIP